MSLYKANDQINVEATLNDPLEFDRAVIFDEICRLSDQDRKDFLASEECKVLEEKGLIGRRTRVQLSKKDDIERRAGMASILIAKDKNDPIFLQLQKVRQKERDLLQKLDTKYAAQAIALAKSGQREYLHSRFKR